MRHRRGRARPPQPGQTICTYCTGEGVVQDAHLRGSTVQFVTCQICGGSGVTELTNSVVNPALAPATIYRTFTCIGCGGIGTCDHTPCLLCRGVGTLDEREIEFVGRVLTSVIQLTKVDPKGFELLCTRLRVLRYGGQTREREQEWDKKLAQALEVEQPKEEQPIMRRRAKFDVFGD
jgi:hypothetical protein